MFHWNTAFVYAAVVAHHESTKVRTRDPGAHSRDKGGVRYGWGGRRPRQHSPTPGHTPRVACALLARSAGRHRLCRVRPRAGPRRTAAPAPSEPASKIPLDGPHHAARVRLRAGGGGEGGRRSARRGPDGALRTVGSGPRAHRQGRQRDLHLYVQRRAVLGVPDQLARCFGHDRARAAAHAVKACTASPTALQPA